MIVIERPNCITLEDTFMKLHFTHEEPYFQIQRQTRSMQCNYVIQMLHLSVM